jgi:hypothetical protein
VGLVPVVIGVPTATPTVTSTPTPQAVSSQPTGNNQITTTTNTEKPRHDEQDTDGRSHDDVHTEGNVVGVERSADGMTALVTIALGPGGHEQLIVQIPCPRQACPDIQVGDYVEADGYQNGVGDPDGYFVAADGIAVWRNGHTVR